MAANDNLDTRSEVRFIAQSRIEGAFGSVELVLIDLGEHGVQAQHATPIKLGTTARLQFVVPGTTQQVRVPACVIWSRISTRPDLSGSHNYRSGLRAEDEAGALKESIERMVELAMLKRDLLSLDKKQKALIEKDKARQHLGVKVVGRGSPRLPGDVILLVKQTRQRLQANPTEAVKWYNRAKYSLDEAGVQIHHRDEILAIWEYLERSVELNIIARIIEDPTK